MSKQMYLPVEVLVNTDGMKDDCIFLKNELTLMKCASPPGEKTNVSAYLQLMLSLNRELFEGFYDDAGVGAVVHIDTGAAHPRLEVIH